MIPAIDSINDLGASSLNALRQVIGELPVACLLLDKEHRVLVWNKACESATGYPAEKMIGTKEAWRAFYPEKRPILADLLVDGHIFQELQTYYSGQIRKSSLFKGVVEIEAFFPLIGEKGRWLYATVAPVRSPEGEIIGAMEVLQDIDSIRQAEQRTSTLFNASPDPMLVVDPRGQILMANKMAELAFGYSSDELIGLPVDSLVPSNYRAAHAGQRQGFMKSGARMPGYQMGGERQLIAMRKDGSEFPAEIVLNRVALGNEVVVICAIRDVTVQRQVQQELRESKELAEAATKAKSEFLANMSHEIRTPMNAVIGLTKLAMRGNLPEPERGYVRKANAAAEALLGILNDVLDFSKIEAGKLTIEYTLVDLRELLENLMATYGLQAREKGLAFDLNIAADVPQMIECDPLRLTQVLGNLCSNAIKFTETGSVSIKVECAASAKAPRLEFVVADTGIGLSPEQISRLFNFFSQADTSISRQYGGSGLGLAISQRLLTLMGGEIALESSLGIGTRIKISLPVLETHSKDYRLSGKRVLIVDDSEISRKQMDALCRWFGMQTCCVAGGVAARIALRRELATGTRFDVMLIDWLMPEEDGLECLRRMHKEFGEQTPAAVLATSASLDEAGDAIRGSGLKLQGLVMKPLNAGNLCEILNLAITGHMKDVAKGLADQSALVRGARILLVDDNEINREVAREWLRVMNVDILEADSGKAALEVLKRERVDAILMDCQMPDMDGLEATRRIRADPAHAGLPIIALSASAMDSDIQDALAAGMNDYLSKPVQESKLYAALARALSATLLEKAPQAPPSEPEHGVFGIKIPGLDTEFGLSAANNKQALYLLILRKFVEVHRDFADKFTEAMARGDRATAQRLAHTIKSGLGYIGAASLALEAGNLEAAFRDGEAAKTIYERFECLASGVTTLIQQLGDALGKDA